MVGGEGDISVRGRTGKRGYRKQPKRRKILISEREDRTTSDGCTEDGETRSGE